MPFKYRTTLTYSCFEDIFDKDTYGVHVISQFSAHTYLHMEQKQSFVLHTEKIILVLQTPCIILCSNVLKYSNEKVRICVSEQHFKSIISKNPIIQIPVLNGSLLWLKRPNMRVPCTITMVL